MKMLLVGDDPGITQDARRWLELHWPTATLVLACDGEAGISSAQREDPDLVILESVVPDMEGFEACSEIRRFSKAPVVMLATSATPTDVARGIESGADDFLIRPFGPALFLARVRAVLRRSSRLSEPLPAFQTGELLEKLRSVAAGINERLGELSPVVAQRPPRPESEETLPYA